MQQQQQPQDLSGLLFRIESVEREIVGLRQQLSLYEPTRENDLKLQSIKDTTLRIETELSKVKERLEGMNTRMVAQERESQDRDTKQRESMDKIQIRVLWGIVATILSIGTAVLIAYLTHLLH